MIAVEQAQRYLEQLGLTQAAAVLDSRLQLAAQKKLAYADFRADLLRAETAARRERYLRTRTRYCWARPASARPISPSRSACAPSNRATASTSCGRTTSSKICAGRRPRHRLDRRMRVYLAPKLLVIDEFGVWPYDRLAATALFALISARYERGSVILTSNKGFAEWGEVLGDPVIATAILDRLLHYSHVLNIRGESYRLREKKRAGLFTGGPAADPEPASSRRRS